MKPALLTLLALVTFFVPLAMAGEKVDEPLFSLELPDGWSVASKEKDAGIHKLQVRHQQGGLLMFMTWKSDLAYSTADAMKQMRKSAESQTDKISIEEPLANWHGQTIKNGTLLLGELNGIPFMWRLYAIETPSTMMTLVEVGNVSTLSELRPSIEAISKSFTLK